MGRDARSCPPTKRGCPIRIPPFDQFTSNKFNYPYVLRDNLTSRRVNHDWRAIYLENEYLKCSVLPDIGGHLYTCIDKISGQSMFYANPSIKKAAVGLSRGLGGFRHRVQLSRLPQLGEHVAGRFRLP